MSASREKKKRQSDAGSNGAASVNASKKGLGKTGKTVLYAILAVVVVAVIFWVVKRIIPALREGKGEKDA